MGAVSTVFLDRDGVINQNRPADYVKRWEEFRFLPGAPRAIARLTRAGYRVVVVSNQACIGKGLARQQDIDEIHRRMVYAVGRAGGRIETVLYCPHRADARCACRKPEPGLLLRARDAFGVDLRQAIFVGDSANDVRAAAAAGIPALLVLTGLGWRTALHASHDNLPHCDFALNLGHAARLILNRNVAPDAEATWLRRAISGARFFERHGGTRDGISPRLAH
jgi:D-glycero-D-manno-heptose 1,7-bisphosphate phosphatase